MQEIVANAFWWDPYGARWGRGAHWPLIFSIGRGRYRSQQMLEKRAKKKIAKKWRWQDTSGAGWRTGGGGKRTGCAGGSREQWQPKWWGVADGEWQSGSQLRQLGRQEVAHLGLGCGLGCGSNPSPRGSNPSRRGSGWGCGLGC